VNLVAAAMLWGVINSGFVILSLDLHLALHERLLGVDSSLCHSHQVIVEHGEGSISSSDSSLGD
jgi:hypothetical protein